MTRNFHRGVESILAIGKRGSNLEVERAKEHILGAAVEIDLMRRDLQLEAKKIGRPWDMGKPFDQSAPCGAIEPLDGRALSGVSAITMTVNGQVRQRSTLPGLIPSRAEILFWLSKYVDLVVGDLICTGTPDGVGPIVAGGVLHAHVGGSSDLLITVGSPA
jgi:fumarylpyruvate hydrolase